MDNLDRRKFIHAAGLTAAGALLGIFNCEGSTERNDSSSDRKLNRGEKSRVAEFRRPEHFRINQRPNPERVKGLLGSSLETFFDVRDPREGLREMFSPMETIGIKVNCLSGRYMSTHVELTWAMVDLLKKSGVDEERIIIWDRSNAELKRAGFELNTGGGVKVYGVDASGYSTSLLIHRSIGSFTANIMKRVDKVINLPVLKDHGIVGVTLGLKNFFGAVHNPNKYHPNCGDPYVADLYSHPLFREKVKLSVVDGIVGQYEGGPPNQPQWQWNFAGLLVGTDPVAVDSRGLDLIESARAEHGIRSLSEASRFPHYLKTAEELGIGNFQREKIEVVTG